MTRAMVLGKFMPPHRGHLYLAEFAGHFADELCVVVGSLPSEPIDGAQRVRWMRELVPGATVVHLDEVLPQLPHEDPAFWSLWTAALNRVLPWPVDLVFAGENYGVTLAAKLGARFVPVPRGSAVSARGTEIREDPMAHWHELPRCVRPYFVRKVAIVGPESTGKSTLARTLAQHFDTAFVPEHARALIESREVPTVDEHDMVEIARGQRAAEFALARNANRVLICDTDALTTCVWSERLFGRVAQALTEWATHDRYDLTLCCAPDVPYVPDTVRFLPGESEAFLQRILGALDLHKRSNVVRLTGDFATRERTAIAAVTALVEAKPRPTEPAR
ncbi:MAG: AAA family ATPase [Deltaproteobacteria bacterium]|nr:AAA family ATPase [Deltaproteobacteria bacterium]